MSTSTQYRTDDMALATYLRMKHHIPVEIVWENNTACWDFNRSPDLMKLVDDFTENKALCNPREFSRMFKYTRQEFHSVRPAQRR